MSEVDKHYGAETGGQHGVGGTSVRHDLSGDTPVVARVAGQVREAAGQVGEAVEGAVEQAKGWSRDATTWASDRYESATRNATYARRRSAVHLSRGQRTVEDFVQENPIMVGVAGLAAGLLIGALVPGTRRENQYFGRYADEMRDQGLRYAQDVAEQGRHIVEENLSRVASGGSERG